MRWLCACFWLVFPCACACGETGTLAGRIAFEGALPEPYLFDLTAKPEDASVCACGKKPPLKPAKRLQVDPESRGVAGVVARLATHDERIPSPSKPFAGPRKPLIDQVGCEFTPFVEWVEAGQSLRLKSSDAVMHSVHFYAQKLNGVTLGSTLAMPDKDKVLTRPCREPGLVALGCDTHIWMCAYVFVVDNPYIEISAAGGKFRMEGIPPGNYKLTLWQAGWEVTPGAPDAKTGKPGAYTYAEPLVLERRVEVQSGENPVAETLTKDGWKK